MGYYIRLLSPRNVIPTLDKLQFALTQQGRAERLELEEGSLTAWTQLRLVRTADDAIAAIERNPVVAGELGAEELQEFNEEIQQCKPASAVHWLQEYFKEVKCIYAFQILNGAHQQDGWGAVNVLLDALQARVGGVTQADGEGFSNEEGCRILWQFSDKVSGTQTMAVLIDEDWISFEMELGNRDHREAFFKGEVPEGVDSYEL